MEHWPPPPAQPPSDHPQENPVPTLSKDPSQAGLDTEPKVEADPKPGKTEDPTPTAANVPQPARAPPGSNNNQPYQTESFIYLKPDHPTLQAIRAFYDLSPRFPNDRFLVRNPAGDPVKGIYYTSNLVREILEANNDRGVKFVHAGVKMFVKQDVGHSKVKEEYDALDPTDKGKAWRIQNEGLPIIEHWVAGARVVKLHHLSVLRTLLKEMFIKISPDGSFRTFPQDLQDRLEDVSLGCCVLRCQPGAPDAEDTFDERLVLPLWRGHSSVNLMLPKEDRRAMLLRFFNESDAELIDNSNTKNQGGGGGGGKQRKGNRIEDRKRAERDYVPLKRGESADEVMADVDEANNEEGGVKLENDDNTADAKMQDDSTEKEGGVKLSDEAGSKRSALAQTEETAAALEGQSGKQAVQTKVEEKDLAAEAELQGQAQADVDLAPQDGGEEFNTTI